MSNIPNDLSIIHRRISAMKKRIADQQHLVQRLQLTGASAGTASALRLLALMQQALTSLMQLREAMSTMDLSLKIGDKEWSKPSADRSHATSKLTLGCPHCGLRMKARIEKGTMHLTYTFSDWQKRCRYPYFGSPSRCQLERHGGGKNIH